MPDRPETWTSFFKWVSPILFSVGAAFGIAKARVSDIEKEITESKDRIKAIEHIVAMQNDQERRITNLERDPQYPFMTEKVHEIVCRANTTETLAQNKMVVDESLSSFKAEINGQIQSEIRMVYAIMREENKK